MNIICFKWGKWNDIYVRRLKNMVERHLTLPHKFVCFSDTPVKGVNCLEIPNDALMLRGNFTKLWAYSEYNGLSGRVILLDLDLVITGSLNEMFSYSGDWCGVKGFRPEKKPKVSGAIVSFDHSKFHHLWDNREQYKKHTGNERFVYGEIFGESADTWQDLYPDQIASYKQGKPFPKNIRVIVFHGKPRPHQVKDSIILENWK